MLAFPLASAPAAQAKSADATVSFGRTIVTVPNSFLGLSVEYGELARYERQAAFGSFLAQLETLGSGPLSLRVGGESADNTYLPSDRKLPGWAYVLTPAWFSSLANLVGSAHLRVIFDLNLAVRSASRAAAAARAALRRLPAGSVQAFEVGNEPDLFRFGVVGLRKVRFSSPGPFRWALSYSPGSYADEFSAYASAVAASAPGVPISGPASADPSTTWWQTLPVGPRRLGLVSIHRYPFAACGMQGTPEYPTVAGFLSSDAVSRLAQSINSSVARANRLGLPLRVTEFGSASCTGHAGATDTFATALWAPDALFGLLAAGVDGVNVHSRFSTSNTPLGGRPSLQARPFFYGLILFARMLGPGARLQRTIMHSAAGVALSAWGVRLSDGTEHVLLINKTGRPLTVALKLPTRSSAVMEALRAPSSAATSRVTLGGQALGSDGLWHGTPVLGAVRRSRAGTYETTVGAYSAEMLGAR